MRKISLVLFLCGLAAVISEDLCWSRFGDHQYKVLTPSGGALFHDAVEECSDINTTLASIHSPEEDIFLEEFVMSQMSLPLWIGLKRVGEELEWVDGTPVNFVSTNYKPKTTLKEGCVYIFMGWSEESCKSAALHFICKRKVSDDDACPTTTTFVSTSTAQSTTTDNKPSSIVTDASTSSSTPSDETTVTSASTTVVTLNPTVTETSTRSLDTQVEVVTTTPDVSATTEREMTFEEMLDEMTVKKKPVFEAIEGANSTAIGSVSIMILIGIVLGIVLLDLNTIKNHFKMLKYNTKDVCKRSNKTDITYLERPKVIKVKSKNEHA